MDPQKIKETVRTFALSPFAFRTIQCGLHMLIIAAFFDPVKVFESNVSLIVTLLHMLSILLLIYYASFIDNVEVNILHEFVFTVLLMGIRFGYPLGTQLITNSSKTVKELTLLIFRIGNYIHVYTPKWELLTFGVFASQYFIFIASIITLHTLFGSFLFKPSFRDYLKQKSPKKMSDTKTSEDFKGMEDRTKVLLDDRTDEKVRSNEKGKEEEESKVDGGHGLRKMEKIETSKSDSSQIGEGNKLDFFCQKEYMSTLKAVYASIRKTHKMSVKTREKLVENCCKEL